MSEGTYFNWRQTLPGFTFILYGILMNPGILTNIEVARLTIESGQTLIGIIFGFITLMSAGALGFLLSQFWWLLFEIIAGGHYGGTKLRERGRPYKILINHKINDDKNDLRTVYNYIVHSEKDDKICGYVRRRWDIFNSLGSTAISIVLGLIFGIFSMSLSKFNLCYHGWIIFSAIVLVPYLLWSSFKKILVEHDEMTILIMRRFFTSARKTEIPSDYFKS